jgi:lysozyme family protein
VSEIHPALVEAIDKILGHEGGFSNHIEDRGGATNYGITIGTLTEYWRLNGVKNPPTIEDVRNLPLSVAKDIYIKLYYERGKLRNVPPPMLYHVMDCCILHGNGGATMLLQLSLNDKFGCGLKVDGGLGALTAAALRKSFYTDAKGLNNELVRQRLIYMDAIVNRDPSQRKFIKGWRVRAKSFIMA